jgi:1-deoxy-D-xylulose-5-phosphate reductoisomerase
MPAALNAANEVAVARFLTGELPFLGIPEVVREVLDVHENEVDPSLEDIKRADGVARTEAMAAVDHVRRRHS